MKSLKRGIANITDSVVSIGLTLVIIAVVMALSYVGYTKFYAANEVTLISNLINETKTCEQVVDMALLTITKH